MSPAAEVTIDWHRGPRAELRELFELAEDSAAALDGYIDLGRVLVAVDGSGDVVGHLQLVEEDDRADEVEVVSLAVRQDVRGRGVGRRLLEQAVAVCRAEGVRLVTLRTATADVGNIRFYQRCGFRPSAIERDAFTPAQGYPPGLVLDGIPLGDAIWFTLELGPGE